MKLTLDELQDIFTSDRLTKSDLVNAMVNFRLVIENENLQGTYQILNLYCNWTVHNQISASKVAFRILEEITNSMIAHDENSSESQWINDAVIEGMSLHKLQLEILDFSNRFGINLSIFSKKGFWIAFGKMLLTRLIDRPLAFPDNINNRDIKKIYDSIVQKANASGALINGVVAISFLKFGNHIHWKMTTLGTKDPTIDIVGPMFIITQDQVDAYWYNKKK